MARSFVMDPARGTCGESRSQEGLEFPRRGSQKNLASDRSNRKAEG
jgi:hypothetical protein